MKQNVRKFLHGMKMQWYDAQIAIGGAWRFFCKQQKAMAGKMASEHYTENTRTEDTSVVFTCNGWIWHGGLADRLKGMVAVYDWCKRYGRQFKINFCEPFLLQDYLMPNKVEWLPQDVVFSEGFSAPKVCLMEPRTCNKKEIADHQDELFESWMDENLSDVSRQLHVYTNMERREVDFGARFNELFRPVPRLQKLIDEHLANIGGKYISISFRFTTLLADFTDCTGTPLSPEERADLIERSLEAINTISQQTPVHDRILVTADSETFLSRAKQMKNVYVVPGKVGHIDYDHGDDVNMKTFLDFFLISMAEKVYLARSGKMYRSAFAKTAALVNDRPFEVFEF